MTVFNETDHPRADAGTFTTKEQTTPEIALAIAHHVPAELAAKHVEVFELQQRFEWAQGQYQRQVGAAFKKHVLETFPQATAVSFKADSDEPDDAPVIYAVWAGEDPLWEAADNNQGVDEFEKSAQAYANEMLSPYGGGGLLEQTDYDDFHGGSFVFPLVENA